MLGPTLLRASRSDRLRDTLQRSPVTAKVVDRFVAGETVRSAIDAAGDLHLAGMATSLDFLGEDVTDQGSARQVRDQYLRLLDELGQADQAVRSEVSVKLSAVGQALPGGGHEIALRHAREICAAAEAVGCRVTLDMEDHTTIDSTLAIGAELRSEFPLTGNVLQANLLRTPGDIERLAGTGARIRIVKGAYNEPAEVAHQRKRQVDDAYAAAIRLLMTSTCYPMIGTHDPEMIREAIAAASEADRDPADWEAQMLFGISTGLQQELVADGRQVRVYIPFGTDWYGYFMRRLAERPANVAFFLRALARRG